MTTKRIAEQEAEAAFDDAAYEIQKFNLTSHTSIAYRQALAGDLVGLRVMVECIVGNPLYGGIGADGRSKGWEGHVTAIMAIAQGFRE